MPSGAVNAAVTNTGTLVYVPGGPQNSSLASLVWVDRHGRETPIPWEPRSYASARISPDGRRVAVDIRDEDQDIWVWESGAADADAPVVRPRHR